MQATIDTVTMETLGQGLDAEVKPVLHFSGDVKAMALNVSNSTIIEEAYGPESDDWKGKIVELFRDPNVMMGSKRVGGLRVRIPNAKPAPTAETRVAVDGAYPWKQVVADAAAAGMSEAALKEALKSAGLNGYSPTADAGTARSIVSKATEASNEVIPF